MRDKFTELIEKGVAKFEYEPIAKPIPEQDMVCRMYNNIFSIPSDTHMSCLDNGTRVITGHMINTPKWGMFTCSPCWGAVNFRTAGFWSVSDFLYKNMLTMEIGTLNGDVVAYIKPLEITTKSKDLPKSYVTTESQIPQPVRQLITDGRIEHLQECYNQEDVVKALNESLYIIGESWIQAGDKIIGLINNKVIIL